MAEIDNIKLRLSHDIASDLKNEVFGLHYVSKYIILSNQCDMVSALEYDIETSNNVLSDEQRECLYSRLRSPIGINL